MNIQPELRNCFGGRFEGRTILVTGHTGFKGSWLCMWLAEMGARVVGYSLEPPTDPNHFELLDIDIESHIGDVRDLSHLTSVCQHSQPDLVMHLAAQPLVRLSYEQPIDTITSNVTGTLNVLEATREVDSVRAIVCITSDKVYENAESEKGYQESDRLGGADPYSCSKACAELITRSFRDSFFPNASFGSGHQRLIATARAGNVIGGGDWATDRLIPDAVRAASCGEPLLVRNPRSVRPWQHVLESLAGYLMLANRLLDGKVEFAKAWNFGPDDDGNVCVAEVIDQMQTDWADVRYVTPEEVGGPHETKILKLNSTMARESLHWLPIWDWRQSVQQTTRWYQHYYASGTALSRTDLQQYLCDAAQKNVEWVS